MVGRSDVRAGESINTKQSAELTSFPLSLLLLNPLLFFSSLMHLPHVTHCTAVQIAAKKFSVLLSARQKSTQPGKRNLADLCSTKSTLTREGGITQVTIIIRGGGNGDTQ